LETEAVTITANEGKRQLM